MKPFLQDIEHGIFATAHQRGRRCHNAGGTGK